MPASARSLVRTLSLAVLLEWAGAGAILPLLPLWVRQRGGSDTVVGVVMASYFAAAFVFQYGSGRVSDRLGRLPVLIGGLSVYAGASLLFLLPVPAVYDAIFRGLQGAGAGASTVASLSMISHAVPLSFRGRSSGRIYGAQLGGLAIGPVLGSVAGVGAMRWLFVAGAAAALGAAVWVMATGTARQEGTSSTPTVRVAPEEGAAPVVGLHSDASATAADVARQAVAGALLASAAIGVATGVYEACWTLLMTRHGAAGWQVGVSWTLFAVPFAALSRPAGWLADHFDRRVLAVGSLLWSVGFLATYPFLPGYVILMVLGVFESFGFALTLPACQSLLGEGTAPERHGHVQGLFAASQTGTTALAAAAAGALFSVAPFVPFAIAAGCCTVLSIAVASIWRRVPGRVTHAVGPTLAAGDR